jgi:hypothetical protein
MILLKLLEVLFIMLIALGLITQIILPPFFGRKLFSAFRRSELGTEVINLNEQVMTLKEKNEQLEALQHLLVQKKEIEARIASLETQSTPTKE